MLVAVAVVVLVDSEAGDVLGDLLVVVVVVVDLAASGREEVPVAVAADLDTSLATG